jgi:hypothetical protein
MTPAQLDALSDSDFAGMLRLMAVEAAEVEKANAKANARRR